MNIEKILKGYVTDNGQLNIANSKNAEQTNTNLEANLKYKRKVIIKIYKNDKELPLKEMRDLKAEEIITELDVYVAIEETGRAIFTIKEQDLKEYYKKYINRHIVILIAIM